MYGVYYLTCEIKGDYTPKSACPLCHFSPCNTSFAASFLQYLTCKQQFYIEYKNFMHGTYVNLLPTLNTLYWTAQTCENLILLSNNLSKNWKKYNKCKYDPQKSQ